MKEAAVFRPKKFRFLTDDGCVHKKALETRRCRIKRGVKFKDYKNCLEKNE